MEENFYNIFMVGNPPVECGTKMADFLFMEAVRQWTWEERQKLFNVYFGPLPGICPVCGYEVCMIMSNLAPRVTLLLTCDGCKNKASVSGFLPVQGPPCVTATGAHIEGNSH